VYKRQVQQIAQQNPALAQQWIDTVPMSAESKQVLRDRAEKLAKK
jgi:hypothetical protein